MDPLMEVLILVAVIGFWQFYTNLKPTSQESEEQKKVREKKKNRWAVASGLAAVLLIFCLGRQSGGGSFGFSGSVKLSDSQSVASSVQPALGYQGRTVIVANATKNKTVQAFYTNGDGKRVYLPDVLQPGENHPYSCGGLAGSAFYVEVKARDGSVKILSNNFDYRQGNAFTWTVEDPKG
jgi:hypothetical protein